MVIDDQGTRPSCAVIGPLFFLTVTIEQEHESHRVHLHPGGQGFWIARMITVLGCEARLVSPIGGEAGDVLAALLPGWEVELQSLKAGIDTPTQIHDRRSGERVEIVEAEIPTLDRHDADDLYAVALETALTSDATVLTSGTDRVLPDDAYPRLARDLAAQGLPVFADLHGGALDSLLEVGGLRLVKVSEDDLAADGWEMGTEQQAVDAARKIAGAGVETVVVSRGSEPAVAVVGDRVVRVTPPALSEVDHRGAGDSMTAGMVTGHLIGLDPIDAVRLGAASGAGNVTRRGLGSGRPELIAELAGLVEIEELS
jgi:1-phosphofructokinase